LKGLTKVKGEVGNYSDVVNRIVDGDTLDLKIKYTIIRVRLSLVNTPERGEQGFKEATDFVKNNCDVGSEALLNVDNKQNLSYNRIVGAVYCETFSTGEDGTITNYWININEVLADIGHAEILTQFCNLSEFNREKWSVEECSNNNSGNIKQNLETATSSSLIKEEEELDTNENGLSNFPISNVSNSSSKNLTQNKNDLQQENNNNTAGGIDSSSTSVFFFF
jgi:micrococcal nuclease